MITTIFIVSVVSTIVLLALLRRRKESGSARRALIAKGLLEFTVPLTVASAFFFVLQLWLNARAITGDTTTIAQIERSIRFIRLTVVKPLILPALAQFFVIVALVLATVVLPKFRQARVLERYRKAGVWITRAYILFTLLASFSFLGGSYNKSAHRAEARLNDQIDEIEREYATAFTSIEQHIGATVAAQIAADPAFAPSLKPVEEMDTNGAAAAAEIALARATIQKAPHVELRDFRLAQIDDAPAKASPPPSTPEPKSPPETASRADWNHRDGAALVREVADAGMDVVHEEVAKSIIATFFAGTPGQAFAELALDSAVMYDFRDVVGDAAAKAFASAATHRARANDAMRAATDAARARVATIASRTAQKLAPWLATRAAASRDEVAAARRGRTTVLAEFHQKANDQAAREAVRLREEITTIGVRATGSEAAAREVAESIVSDVESNGLERVARLREIRQSVGIGTEPTGSVIEGLIAYERQHDLGTTFKDSVDERLREVLAPERDGEWGELRGEAYLQFLQRSVLEPDAKGILEIIEPWESYKRTAAMQMIINDVEPTVETWERTFSDYCRRHEDMAVMWGWFVKDSHHEIIAAKYTVENVVPEHGYRYYLEQNGFGGRFDAAAVFVHPKAQKTIGNYCRSN
jgi:hypothetical protein